jgi:hypothetical protein
VEKKENRWLAGEAAKEFLFVHPVLEGFVPVDEYDWHLVVELPAQLIVGIDVDLAPMKAAAPVQLDQTLLYHLTKMATLACV